MSDDGRGRDLTIPAVLINKADGKKIQDFYIKNKVCVSTSNATGGMTLYLEPRSSGFPPFLPKDTNLATVLGGGRTSRVIPARSFCPYQFNLQYHSRRSLVPPPRRIGTFLVTASFQSNSGNTSGAPSP